MNQEVRTSAEGGEGEVGAGGELRKLGTVTVANVRVRWWISGGAQKIFRGWICMCHFRNSYLPFNWTELKIKGPVTSPLPPAASLHQKLQSTGLLFSLGRKSVVWQPWPSMLGDCQGGVGVWWPSLPEDRPEDRGREWTWGPLSGRDWIPFSNGTTGSLRLSALQKWKV